MRTLPSLYFAVRLYEASPQIIPQDQSLEQPGNLQESSSPDRSDSLLSDGGEFVQSGRLNLQWSNVETEYRNARINDLLSRIWGQFDKIAFLRLDYLNLRETFDRGRSKPEPNAKGGIKCGRTRLFL